LGHARQELATSKAGQGGGVAEPVASIEGEVGGVRFRDPYQGLEADTEAVLAWQAAENERARDYLQQWDGFENLRQSLEPLIGAHLVFAPLERGGKWFRPELVATGVGVVASDEPLGEGNVVVDPQAQSLDWWSVSPLGRYVAYGVSSHGDEQSVLHVVDMEAKRTLSERILFTSFARLAWLPDESGFYYSAGTAPDTENAQKHIWFHRVGEEPPSQPEAVPAREEFVYPQTSPDGRYVAQLASEIETRPDYLLDREEGKWRPFLRDQIGVFVGEFLDDAYLALTTNGADRGRVVSIPLDAPNDPARWTELIPEGDGVLRDVSLVGGKLVVTALVDGHSRIAIHALDGTHVRDVELPGLGATGDHSIFWGHVIFEPLVASASDSFTFVFSDHTRSGAVYRCFVESGEVVELSAPAVDLSGTLTTTRLETTSSDGRSVAMWVLRRADSTGALPTLLYGYGGWNIAFMPVFYGALAAYALAGGAVAFVNLRGGGELGWDGWQQGRLKSKQQTFDDLYAAAQFLVAEGISSRDRLAVAGASNGGLLAAVAVVQRPDLWRAVVSLVPLTDLLRFKRNSYATECTEEYGDPDDPEFAPVLAAYSPAHNVRSDTRYPSTLVVCGGGDIRCPAWHGRKLVAALQHETTSGHPVLLRVWPEAPHRAGVLGDEAQMAEWVGFLLRETGLAQ
jgi:prolyl oligopeptidase